jgi:surfeit locus 1 family protein
MSGRFRPLLIPTLALLVFFPLFIFLGYWQLHRAEEKRGLQAEYDRRASDAVVRIGPRLQPAEELRFYKVVTKGNYETGYQVLLDNRVHRGQAGYHVITPLHIEGGQARVLVNRGWMPLGKDREHLPRVDTPSGPQVIHGVATVPAEEVFMLAESESITGGWPPVWQHMDMGRYAKAAPFPVQPVVILLDPKSQAGGFIREWSRLDVGIAVHHGYAFQWFMLAATLLVLYLFLGRRAAKQIDSE